MLEGKASYADICSVLIASLISWSTWSSTSRSDCLASSSGGSSSQCYRCSSGPCGRRAFTALVGKRRGADRARDGASDRVRRCVDSYGCGCQSPGEPPELAGVVQKARIGRPG